MDKIAFIIGETFLYWNSIFLVLGALTAATLFLAFYLGRSGNAVAAFLSIPLCIGLSIVLARFVHWYCQSDSYGSMFTAMTDYFSGSYALCGVFIGCLLAGCLLRMSQCVKDLPELLDSMALAGTAGIAVGRMGGFFTSTDRGSILAESWELPYAWPVINSVTGASENRMAIFLLQAIFCAGIFVILTLFWLISRKKSRSGTAFLLFLLLYGSSQIVFDSMRYDSLFLRSNGFVSLVQILCAVAVIFAIVCFSVRAVKSFGLRWWYFVIWLLILGGLGMAGYMEYYVQRHGNLALFSYTTMSCSLGLVILLTLTLAILGGMKRKAAKPAMDAPVEDIPCEEIALVEFPLEEILTEELLAEEPITEEENQQ